MCLQRDRRIEDERESRRLIALGGGAFVIDCGRDALCTQIDVSFVSLGTRNGQHQSRRVTEVFNEVDWTSATRQIVNAVELQLDVVKFFAGLFQILVELDVDNRKARARDRLNLRDFRVCSQDRKSTRLNSSH